VGPATAKKWIKDGLTSIDDALLNLDNVAKDDSRIAIGWYLLCFFIFLKIICTTILVNKAEYIEIRHWDTLALDINIDISYSYKYWREV